MGQCSELAGILGGLIHPGVETVRRGVAGTVDDAPGIKIFFLIAQKNCFLLD